MQARAFLAGMVIGGLLTAAVMLAFRSAPHATEEPVARTNAPTPQAVDDVGGATEAPTTRKRVVVTPPSERGFGSPSNAAPFAPGHAVLRIGDGYMFGEDRVRPGARARSVDIVCQDIHHAASLRCAHGSAAVDVPLMSIGIPTEVAEAAALATDAPTAMADRNATLIARVETQNPGVWFVRAKDGLTFRLHLVKLHGAVDARDRRVEIAYAEVPTVDGGGRIVTATVADDTVEDPLMRSDIERRRNLSRVHPGNSFTGFLPLGDWKGVDDVTPEMKVDREQQLVLDGPFATSIDLRRGGALYFRDGIATSGKVSFDGYTGLVVAGDMAGTVVHDSYGYAHVDGDLSGTYHVNSYGTIVIEGDITGTLEVRSYTDLLLRGRVLGTLDADGSCWSTFLFESLTTEAQLRAMGDDFDQVTLHLRVSDLPVGTHENVGSWREVIVGDPLWEKLGR